MSDEEELMDRLHLLDAKCEMTDPERPFRCSKCQRIGDRKFIFDMQCPGEAFRQKEMDYEERED